MRLSILLFFLMTSVTSLLAQRPYVTVWKTDNPGVTGPTEIRVPAFGGYTYTWEELSNPANNGSGSGADQLNITFPSTGTYRLKITPAGQTPFHRISHPSVSDNAKLLDIEQWGDVVWSNMEMAYNGCVNLRGAGAVDVPDLSKVTNMSRMFYGATSFNQPIGNWNVSNVVNMVQTFANASVFNQNIDSWNVGKVTSMLGMFQNASAFNQPIGSWNVSNVTDMSNMFQQAFAFNQNINNWNVANVTTMYYMFHSARNFNQPVGNWDVGNVTNMHAMFGNDRFFNQDISNWNVGKVTSMVYMFGAAAAFNQDISAWNTSSLTLAGEMFTNATSFNQDLQDWDVSKITYFYGMFDGATAFNQNLGAWELASVTNANVMLRNSGISCENYTLTLRGWADNPATLSGVRLGAQGRTYGPDATSARNTLTATKGWTIFDDIFSSGCALPVKLVNFKADANERRQADISWTTTEEVNSSHFEVEHSTDSKNWQILATILSNTNSSSFKRYAYRHTNAPAGINYYRLRMVDLDETFAYSPIRSVEILNGETLQMYPNPVHNELVIEGLKGSELVTILDVSGRTMSVGRNETEKNKQVLNIGPLATGIYLINIQMPDGSLVSQKIFKKE